MISCCRLWLSPVQRHRNRQMYQTALPFPEMSCRSSASAQLFPEIASATHNPTLQLYRQASAHRRRKNSVNCLLPGKRRISAGPDREKGQKTALAKGFVPAVNSEMAQNCSDNPIPIVSVPASRHHHASQKGQRQFCASRSKQRPRLESFPRETGRYIARCHRHKDGLFGCIRQREKFGVYF